MLPSHGYEPSASRTTLIASSSAAKKAFLDVQCWDLACLITESSALNLIGPTIITAKAASECPAFPCSLASAE